MPAAKPKSRKSAAEETAPADTKLPSLVIAETPIRRAAEEVVEAAVDNRRRLTLADREALETAGINNQALLRMVSKGVTIRNHQRNAGTAAERAAAEQRLADAKRKLTKEGAKLEEVIANAQRELHALNRAVKAAEESLGPMLRAVEHLQQDRILPDYLQTHLSVLEAEVGAPFVTRQNELIEENQRLNIILDATYAEHGGILPPGHPPITPHSGRVGLTSLVNALRHYGLNAVEMQIDYVYQLPNGHGQQPDSYAAVSCVGFDELRAKAASMLEENNAAREQLAADRHAAEEELRKLRSCYVPQ